MRAGARASPRSARGHGWKIRLLGWITLGFTLVAIGTWVARDALLRKLVEHQFTRQLGTRAHVGRLDTHLGSRSVSIQKLRVKNPPGFGVAPLLDMPELTITVGGVRGGRLQLAELRVHIRELNVVRANDGRLNLDKLQDPPKAGKSRRGNVNGADILGGIHRVELTVEKINFTDLAQPLNSRVIALDIDHERGTNFTTQAQLENWVRALLLRGVVRDYLSNPRPLPRFLESWSR